jgi:hypothetical protein
MPPTHTSSAQAIRLSPVWRKVTNGVRAHDIPKHGPWSAFILTRLFTWTLAQAQLERSAKPRFCKRLQVCKAA